MHVREFLLRRLPLIPVCLSVFYPLRHINLRAPIWHWMPSNEAAVMLHNWQANKMELHAMKEAMKIRIESHEACERILSLKEGWHIVMEKDKDQLTGNKLMGGRSFWSRQHA